MMAEEKTMDPASRKMVKAKNKDSVWECSSWAGRGRQCWQLTAEGGSLHRPALVTGSGIYLPETNWIAFPNTTRLRSHINAASKSVTLYQKSSKRIGLINSLNIHGPPFKHRVLKLAWHLENGNF